MLHAAVYDLMVAAPHTPADEKFTAAEFYLYRRGYDMALVMSLRAMKAAEDRFSIYARTKRLDAARRRKESGEATR